jgi:hypothetical protein
VPTNPVGEYKIMELVSVGHSIGRYIYDLEWCPKYRYNMFRAREIKSFVKIFYTRLLNVTT